MGPNGARLELDSVSRPARRAAGHVPLRLVTPDGDTVRYTPVAPFAPTAAQLAEYAGTYTSDEAQGTLVVSMENGALRLRDQYGRDAGTPPPLYPDAFGNAGQGIRFVRDARGKVVALSVRESRAWDVRFVRQR
jgi:hypothetical protein